MRIELPPTVQETNRDKCLRLLTSFTGEVQNHLRGGLPGSPRFLAFGDAAEELQADGLLMIANFEKESGNFSAFSTYIHTVGKKTALEETQRSREQDVKNYPGYKSARETIDALIFKTVSPLEVLFLPGIDLRTALSKDITDAEAQIFLGEVLGKIVASPHEEFIFE